MRRGSSRASGSGFMGCCEGKLADGASKHTRAARWRSTGIAALRDAKLKNIPREVLEMADSIRTLDATQNKIAVLPPDIGNFVNLQRLMLAMNCLQSLPPTIGKLQHLKVLALDNNRLEGLPAEVGAMSKLEKLSISGNSLKDLPDVFGTMQNLVVLDLSKNRLKGFPASLGSCQSLEELEASDNAVEQLPESFCNLAHLKALRLDGNRLKKLPPQLLKSTTNLQNLSLHRNPIRAEDLHQMNGFQEFEARRKRKFDKQLDGNVMLNSKGFDEGVDMKRL